MHGHATAEGLAALSLWSAFLLGLAGGFGHCLAMCGPLVGALSVADASACRTAGGAASGGRAVRFQVAYHIGRVATYAVIGALLGALGGAGALDTLSGPLSPEVLSRWLKLGAGVLAAATGVIVLVAWARGRNARLPEPTAALASTRWFRAATKRLSADGRSPFLFGMLMGLLPCAPLLPVELTALATGEPLAGALVMLAFGLGTIPALAGVGAVGGAVAGGGARWAMPAAGVAALVLGLLTVAQGLALAGLA